MMPAVPDWLRRRQAEAAMPIGVEFSAECLYMVQCEPAQQGMQIRAATSIAYGSSREEVLADKKLLKKLVRQAFASAPFKGRRVHSCLDAGNVRIIPLTVAVSSGQKEAAAIIKALKEKLRSDLSDEIVDYLVLSNAGTAGPDNSVLATVAKRDAVMAHLAMLEMSGMEPVSVEVGPAALARLLAHMQHGGQDQPLILINFGADKSYITGIRGHRLMLDREVPFGLSSLVRQLAERLDVNLAVAERLLQQAPQHPDQTAGLTCDSAQQVMDEVLYSQFNILAEEVGRTLVYIASKTHGSPTRAIYLNGSLARYAYVQGKAQSLFDVPVHILDPISMFRPAGPAALAAGLAPHAPLALAAGLALRG